MTLLQHSLANYPKEFITCVVTKGKICLQFGNVDVKLRYKEGGEYIKLPSTTKALPIPISGTKVDITSVGCPLEVIFSMMDDLIGALGEYYSLHTPSDEKIEFINKVDLASTYLSSLVSMMKKEQKSCPKKAKKLKQPS